MSSILTGILWGFWHIGKFTLFAIYGFLLFILLIIEFSIIMAWVYSKFSAKMINMIIFHFGINISSLILLNNREGIAFYLVAGSTGAIVCLVLFIFSRNRFNNKLTFRLVNYDE